jgi:Xaa-Pro aminopeptidase
MEPVPAAEITRRVAALQGWLPEAGVTLALLRQNADLYYYTGVVVDGFLAVPATGAPRLLVRRPKQPLKPGETPVKSVIYATLKEIPGLLRQAGLSWQGGLGLELDVLSADLYLKLREQLFPEASLQDISPLIRRQRMVKSAYELEQLGRAAAILDQVHEEVPALLKPGVTELEVAAALEYRLRLLGHQGLVRVRNPDLEMFYGHVLSGASGLKAAYTDTPSGGGGLSPAFPQGAGLKPLAPGEPLSIDLAACVNGYVVDMTRMYALGGLPEPALAAYGVVEELYSLYVAEARPGVLPGKLYHRLWDVVRARGLQDYFMGQGPDRVSFLAHGVGLELDEYPLLSARFPFPLEADMVLAFEPKFFLPGIGMIGLEDTGRITPTGVEWLTRSPRGITVI